MTNHIVWFDIPVIKLERAIRFYANVLNIKISKDFPDMPVGVFAHEENAVSGCLYETKDDKPADSGILIYFNANGRLDEALKEVVNFGGFILKDKQQIGPYGFRAIVLDSEGNRIALHSQA